MMLESFLHPTQTELFGLLTKQFKRHYVCKENFILVPGKVPVMLLAHLDTVHDAPVKTICRSDNRNILMSPEGIGGDDRCGVYALCEIHERSEYKPWLLFTCDEEIGGMGAKTFCKVHAEKKLPAELDSLKMLIEIDRKGRDDAVYYDCDNSKFERYITSKGFKTAFGSFSDISLIAPELGVAAVNLSSGYYNAHTKHEYINRKHLNSTIGKVIQILGDVATQFNFPRYEYIKKKWTYYGGKWDDDKCGSFWGYGTSGRYNGIKSDWLYAADDLENDLRDVPVYLRDDYELLLDYYSKTELDDFRAQCGDGIIAELVKDFALDLRFKEDLI